MRVRTYKVVSAAALSSSRLPQEANDFPRFSGWRPVLNSGTPYNVFDVAALQYARFSEAVAVA